MDGIGPPGVLVLGRPHISTGAVHMRPDVNCCTPCRIWPMAYYCPLQSMSSIMREKKTFPCDQCSIAQKKAPLLKRHKTQDVHSLSVGYDQPYPFLLRHQAHRFFSPFFSILTSPSPNGSPFREAFLGSLHPKVQAMTHKTRHVLTHQASNSGACQLIFPRQ